MCNMNLTRLRNEKDLTLADLAEKIGMDPATVQRAEKMHPSAKLTTYKLCADALGVTLADIFSEGITPEERELLAAFRAAREGQRGIFRSLIEAAKDRALAEDPEGGASRSETGNE